MIIQYNKWKCPFKAYSSCHKNKTVLWHLLPVSQSSRFSTKSEPTANQSNIAFIGNKQHFMCLSDIQIKKGMDYISYFSYISDLTTFYRCGYGLRAQLKHSKNSTRKDPDYLSNDPQKKEKENQDPHKIHSSCTRQMLTSLVSQRKG